MFKCRLIDLYHSHCVKKMPCNKLTIVNQSSCDRNFPFHKQVMPLTQHLENVFNSQQIFLNKIKGKGKILSNHLASNLEPLFPNIPLKHCTTRFIRQISTKFNYTNVTFLNTNDRAVPTYK